MTSVFAASQGHEQVVHVQDPRSGLRAIIAVHSTALGPGLGGTRFHPYASEDDALEDVLRLSRAMSYKNALAGLDHGGGKAVIIGDPATDKSEALLRAYGRFVQSLGGRYVTACDVGTYVTDMDVVARECRWVTGRSTASGGAGARRAGVGIGTVFRHFPTKADLLRALMKDLLADLTADLAAPGSDLFTFFTRLVRESAAKRSIIFATAHCTALATKCVTMRIRIANSSLFLCGNSSRAKI